MIIYNFFNQKTQSRKQSKKFQQKFIENVYIYINYRRLQINLKICVVLKLKFNYRHFTFPAYYFQNITQLIHSFRLHHQKMQLAHQQVHVFVHLRDVYSSVSLNDFPHKFLKKFKLGIVLKNKRKCKKVIPFHIHHICKGGFRRGQLFWESLRNALA